LNGIIVDCGPSPSRDRICQVVEADFSVYSFDGIRGNEASQTGQKEVNEVLYISKMCVIKVHP
jgi:hypothetical protein